MEIITFSAKGHHNILGRHRNTIEFTKDRELSPRGDCIIALASDFSLEKLKPVLGWKRAKVTVECKEMEETIEGVPNRLFKSEHEIVLRVTDFASERTLLTRCDKACMHLKREFVDALKNGDADILVTIENIS